MATTADSRATINSEKTDSSVASSRESWHHVEYKGIESQNANAVSVQQVDGTDDISEGEARSLTKGLRSLYRVWYWELLSAALSVASFIAIVVVLGTRDGRPVPNWPSPITVNSLIASFTVIFKAALVMPIAEGLSQLKWSQLAREPHSLAQMEGLDSASRGPSGAFFFLFGSTSMSDRRAIPTLGALLILVAIAIDPFSQAVIDYDPCQRPDEADTARIPRTNRWNWVNTLPNETSHWFETHFLAGLLTPPSNTSSLVDVHCPSGNCTFPADDEGAAFSSLAMCYSCDDITDHVIVEDDGGQYRLPPYDRQIPGDTYSQFWTPPVAPVDHTSQEDVDSFFSFSGLMLNHPGMDPDDGCVRAIPVAADEVNATTTTTTTTNTTTPATTLGRGSKFENCKTEPFAFHCSLTPCIKTYRASINNFVYTEREISSEPLLPSRLTTGFDEDDPGWQDWLGYYPMYSLASEKILREGRWEGCEHRDRNESDFVVAVDRGKGTLQWHLDGEYGNDTVWYERDCTWLLQSFPFWWTYEWVRAQMGNVTMDDGDIRTNGPPRHKLDPTWARRLYNRGDASMATVRELMEGVADTMTVYMRRYSQDDDDVKFVRGIVMVNDTCVAVQWAWMSFLAIMLLLTMVFLGATIIYWWQGSWREDWKSSSLAVLFHGVEPPRRGLLRQGEIYKASRDVKVQLRGDGNDWQFRRVDSDPVR